MLKKLVPLLIAIAPSAWASVVWRGDFETGDLSQFSEVQQVSPDRLQIVTSPVRQGKYALKATVKQGDNPIGASGNRDEIVYDSFEPMGSEYYYAWSVMVDQSYPSVDTWQIFTQWHHNSCCGSPPLQFQVRGEEMQLVTPGGPTGDLVVWHAPLVRGVWHDLVFHVKWSDDPSVGFVELYYDGQLSLPKTPLATNMPGTLNYIKMGQYRSEDVTQDGIVYLDGMTQATTLEDVMPSSAPPPPPDAGTPAPAPQPGPTPTPTPAPTPGASQPPAPTGSSTQAATAGGQTPISDANESPATQGAGCSSVPMSAPVALIALVGLLAVANRRRKAAVRSRVK